MLFYTKNLDGVKKVFPLDVCCLSVNLIALETALEPEGKSELPHFLIETKSSSQHKFLIQ